MEDKNNKNTKNSEQSDNEFYEVEAILDKRKIGSKWKYLIKWVGWSVNSCTWEPEENLNCNQLVKDFENVWKEKNHIFTDKNSLEKKKRFRKPSLDSLTSSENDELSSQSEKNKKSFMKKRGRPRKLTENRYNSNAHKNIFSSSEEQQKTVERDNSDQNKDDSIKENNAFKSTAIMNFLEANLDFDTPIKIKKCKRIADKINLLIEWKERDDGVKPEDSYVCNIELRKKHYNFLIDFYESRISFSNENKENI